MVDTRQPAGPATRFVIVFVAALAAATATAGTWAGTVRNAEGEPMHGVMVRFTHDGTGVSESVFTDAKGGFEWTGQRNGTLQLRLRTPYYRDLELAVEEGDSMMTLSMEAMTGDREISDSLPAGYHFGSLPFETGEDALFNRHQFQRDCLTCHQMGNPITRFPRTPEGWVETIRRMHAYLGNFDAELDGFKSKVYPMPEFAPGFRPAPYALGVHPDTGDIWINENMTDRIYRFIPAEERYVVYPVPLSGTYTRDMDFTADGQACTSNNPVPATALEGGVLQVICIDLQPAQEA